MLSALGIQLVRLAMLPTQFAMAYMAPQDPAILGVMNASNVLVFTSFMVKLHWALP